MKRTFVIFGFVLLQISGCDTDKNITLQAGELKIVLDDSGKLLALTNPKGTGFHFADTLSQTAQRVQPSRPMA